MKENFIPSISVIWTNRLQTIKESTEDLIIFLKRLKRFDNRLGVWYERANNRKEGMKNRVVLDYDYIKKSLCKKCEDGDYPPEFTFLTGFWNGAQTDPLSYGIRFSLGGDAKIGTNNCVLTFPYEGEIYESYCVRENWEKLMELFIDHWQPEQYRDFDNQLVKLL
ncbi:hypothetical protein [Aquimarina sp. SS2-1]|uniref:hypothetical protein n=1 Tax=Aquimarina besae TaxID=3342247 RepID=UPI00366EFADA